MNSYEGREGKKVAHRISTAFLNKNFSRLQAASAGEKKKKIGDKGKTARGARLPFAARGAVAKKKDGKKKKEGTPSRRKSLLLVRRNVAQERGPAIVWRGKLSMPAVILAMSGEKKGDSLPLGNDRGADLSGHQKKKGRSRSLISLRVEKKKERFGGAIGRGGGKGPAQNTFDSGGLRRPSASAEKKGRKEDNRRPAGAGAKLAGWLTCWEKPKEGGGGEK